MSRIVKAFYKGFETYHVACNELVILLFYTVKYIYIYYYYHC